MLRRQLCGCLCLVSLLMLSGCGGKPNGAGEGSASGSSDVGGKSSTAGKSGKGTIGVSILTNTNPFFKTIGDSIKAKAAEAGYDTVVLSGDDKVEQQQSQVKDFIVQRVAAIVLCPCDSKAIGPVIQEANAAGIPVFTADIACLAPEAKVVSHIATDNYAGGKQAAEAMIEALGDRGGQVGILDKKEVESCLLRVKGFKEVIDAHNAAHADRAVTIVSELPSVGRQDIAFKSAEDMLQANPQLAGIFAINDPAALGARAALEKAGKTEQVKIVGFDGQLDGKVAIRDGKIYADPIQFPDRIGSMTVESILAYFAGEEVSPQQLIPTAIYRKADAEKDPEVIGAK
ncbi:MAG: substrate-binding domain-containing protein [Pirellulales bacterium]